MQFDRARSGSLWNLHADTVAKLHGFDATEKWHGLMPVTGQLPTDLLVQILETSKQLKPKVRVNEVHPWYHGRPRTEDELRNLNHAYEYFVHCGRVQWLMNELTEFVAPIIHKTLGTPFTVYNAKISNIPFIADHRDAGPAGWHQDAFPGFLMKVLFYVPHRDGEALPVNSDTSTTELEVEGQVSAVEGGPGTFAIFHASGMRHRAVRPQSEGVVRLSAELTIAPTMSFDLRPVHAGMNSNFPKAPFLKPTYWGGLKPQYVEIET